jgi:hypothetical protein
LFFVILAGVTYTVPLNETFFLSADISSFNTGIDSPSGKLTPLPDSILTLPRLWTMDALGRLWSHD